MPRGDDAGSHRREIQGPDPLKKLRFSELHRAITCATPKMLTQQLWEPEAQKLIHREVYPVIPPKVEYSLTQTGRSMLPILTAMRDWGAEYLRQKHCAQLLYDVRRPCRNLNASVKKGTGI